MLEITTLHRLLWEPERHLVIHPTLQSLLASPQGAWGRWMTNSNLLWLLILCWALWQGLNLILSHFLLILIKSRNNCFCHFFWWRNWGRAIAVDAGREVAPEPKKANDTGNLEGAAFSFPSVLILLIYNVLLPTWSLTKQCSFFKAMYIKPQSVSHFWLSPFAIWLTVIWVALSYSKLTTMW